MQVAGSVQRAGTRPGGGGEPRAGVQGQAEEQRRHRGGQGAEARGAGDGVCGPLHPAARGRGASLGAADQHRRRGSAGRVGGAVLRGAGLRQGG